MQGVNNFHSVTNGLIKVIHFCSRFFVSKQKNVKRRSFEKARNIAIKKRHMKIERFISKLHCISLNISATQIYKKTIKLYIDFLQNELQEGVMLVKVS